MPATPTSTSSPGGRGPRARRCSTPPASPSRSEAEDRERRGDILRIIPIDDRTRPGASTWQSLARGLPVEVDHLNGEIVLLGRLHGVPTPVNELLQAATHAAVAARTPPGSVPAADLLARL